MYSCKPVINLIARGKSLNLEMFLKIKKDMYEIHILIFSGA